MNNLSNHLKKNNLGFLFILIVILIFSQSSVINAQDLSIASTTVSGKIILIDPASTESASSTASAIATTSAQEKIQERKDKDITDTGGKQKSELALFLENNPPGPLSWNNFLQHAIINAVEAGMPVNIIVLVLLFPLIAALIAASRHIIGLRGFGIYIPAVLSMAFVSTGILVGLLLFLAISGTVVIANRIIKKTKMPYLPRTALLIWTISFGLFGLFMIAPFVNLTDLMSINIFPILILVLLSENFLDAQSRTKERDAIALTIETIILAILSSVLLGWSPLQRLALSEPELLLVATALLSFVIGKFSGLRVSERLRFRSLIEEE